jgi:cyclohexyl-isocyanide hydratase
MKIAFLIFDRMTGLDFLGVYDPVTRLKTMGFKKDLHWDIRSFTKTVMDDSGLIFKPTHVGGSLRGYDLLIIPGGFGTRKLRRNKAFVNWLRTGSDCPLKASVCTGALLLGAAGFLKGQKATTHPKAFPLLREYCRQVIDRRIVDQGPVVTARGVTSAIDLGLRLCERIAGKGVSERIRKQMDYRTADR